MIQFIHRENVTSTRYAVNTRVRAFRTPYVREYAEVTFVVFRFRVTFSGRCRRLYQSSREFNAFTPNSFLHFTFSLIFFFRTSKVSLVCIYTCVYIRDVYFYDLYHKYIRKIHRYVKFLGVHVSHFRCHVYWSPTARNRDVAFPRTLLSGLSVAAINGRTSPISTCFTAGGEGVRRNSSDEKCSWENTAGSHVRREDLHAHHTGSSLRGSSANLDLRRVDRIENSSAFNGRSSMPRCVCVHRVCAQCCAYAHT